MAQAGVEMGRLVLLIAVLATVLVACNQFLVESLASFLVTRNQSPGDSAKAGGPEATQTNRGAEIRAERTAECDRLAPMLIEGLRVPAAAKGHAEAMQAASRCTVWNDQVRQAHAQALAQDLAAQVIDRKAGIDDRVQAYQTLTARFPSEPGPWKQVGEKLLAQQQLRKERETAARRKSEGVRIGMTQDDVLASNWGKPRKVNRTISARGTREQWVYDGSYLYFEDGVLTVIQN